MPNDNRILQGIKAETNKECTTSDRHHCAPRISKNNKNKTKLSTSSAPRQVIFTVHFGHAGLKQQEKNDRRFEQTVNYSFSRKVTAKIC